jgi:ethanolamine ammonia-lyase small subunit
VENPMEHKGNLPNQFAHLKSFTEARIGIGRSGSSVPTAEWMKFKLAHARAKDAVYEAFNSEECIARLKEMGLSVLEVQSNVDGFMDYLKRPDLGRQLQEKDGKLLAETQHKDGPFDVVLIVASGLSAGAIHANAVPFINAVVPLLKKHGLKIAPIIIAHHSRVALQDPVGEALKAKVAVTLIGERPGLVSAESMGIYMVFQPLTGKTDADRNCISNVRKNGLSPEAAAGQLHRLVTATLKQCVSGVQLKVDAYDLIEDSPSNR